MTTKQTFKLPTLSKTNHSPVFQTNSNTVIQCTSFNVKPTKMLSDPVADAFGLIHRHPWGENLLARPRRNQASLLFRGNISHLSLLHVTECGRLTNLITRSLQLGLVSTSQKKMRAVIFFNFGVLPQEK